MTYGARPEDWLNFDLGLGLGEYLLPVVSNPFASISPNSSLKHLGKVPSVYNRERQIVGIANWTQHKTTFKEIEKWSAEPDYSICARLGLLRAVDGDITDAFLAKEVEDVIRAYVIDAPVRRRKNSPKFLIPFIIQGGPYPKRVLKTQHGIIEFLADSQQALLCGTHPSGVRYQGLENVNSFPEISFEQFESLWAALAERFAIEPPNESSLRKPPQGDYAAPDEVSQYLADSGRVVGVGKEGQHFLECPFAHEHSEPDEPGGTATAYFPPSRGYEQGHFKCLHAHCAGREDEDFLDAVGYRAKDFDIAPDEKPNKPKPPRFEITKASDYARRPTVKWLIKDIMPEKGFYQFFGGSGDGKTFVVLDMMLCLCRGLNWNGRRVKRRHKVVYVCAEGARGREPRGACV